MSDSSDSDGSDTSSDVEDLVTFALNNASASIGCSLDESSPGPLLSPASPSGVSTTQNINRQGGGIGDAHSPSTAIIIDRRPGPVVNTENESEGESSDESEVDMDLSTCLVTSASKLDSRQHSRAPNLMKFGKYQLSSALSANIDTKDLYIDQLTSTAPLQIKDTSRKVVASSSSSQPPPLVDISRRQLKKQHRKERESTKGQKWYNLPATEMTEESKNDLMVIQMRKVLDPKRFYKGPDIRGALPKYFQLGTIVEGPADFYSSRIPKKKRKQTLVDELLEDAEFRRYNKKKYAEIQEAQPRRRMKALKHMKRQKGKK